MVETEQSQAPRRNGKSAAAFRTISEVADDLDVPPHVLRFWETKFSQVRPLKRGGGRRYYRPEDVALLERIRELLYREGYTIKGVQKLLRDGAVRMPTAGEAARAAQAANPRRGGHPEPARAAPSVPSTGRSERPAATATEPSAPTGPQAAEAVPPASAGSPVAANHDAPAGRDHRAELSAVLEELKALRRILAEARR